MSRNQYLFIKLILSVSFITSLLGFVWLGLSFHVEGFRINRGCLHRHRLKELETAFERQYGANATPSDLREFALKTTADSLYFVLRYNNLTDPNRIMDGREAHCVMYTIVYACIYNQIAHDRHWKTTCRVAKSRVYLFGVNLHQFVSSPFFSSHDICVIKNGDNLHAIDALIFDYLKS